MTEAMTGQTALDSTTELLIAFTEASSDIAANASHNTILHHGVVAVVLNRNFSLRFGSVNRFEPIFPSLIWSPCWG